MILNLLIYHNNPYSMLLIFTFYLYFILFSCGWYCMHMICLQSIRLPKSIKYIINLASKYTFFEYLFMNFNSTDHTRLYNSTTSIKRKKPNKHYQARIRFISCFIQRKHHLCRLSRVEDMFRYDCIITIYLMQH